MRELCRYWARNSRDISDRHEIKGLCSATKFEMLHNRELPAALDYAHKQGLLHRDVKPANIMLTNFDDEGERRILLSDFGIARTVDDVSGLTTTNMTVGTVAYSAPEQLMGEDIGGRPDQYSLAATAYHLLTGTELSRLWRPRD